MNMATSLVCTSSVALVMLVACGGRSETSESATATAAARQAAAAPKLYSVDYHPRGATVGASATVHALDAEVDDAGSAYVLARVIACPDCPVDYYAFVFDRGGAMAAQFEVLSAPGEARSVRQMRVNATGFVAAGDAVDGATSSILVERFDASNTQMFEAQVPAEGWRGGVDLCEDGSTVVLDVTGQATKVDALDTSGALVWTTTLPGLTGGKVRCTGAGIYVGGTADGSASVARLESDGTVEWTWTASAPSGSFTDFDLGNDGNVDLLAGSNVFALARDGSLAWSIVATQSLVGISAGDLVSIAGSTAAGDGGTELYTGSYDSAGRSVCSISDATMSGGAYGVSLDDAGEAFVCGSSGAALYGEDGQTRWTYPGSVLSVRTDVTNGIARCIGESATNGLGIVAFRVP